MIRGITGAILAGGKSSRMGRNKALLEFHGVRLIDRVASLLHSLFPEVLLIANDPHPYLHLGLPIIPDAFPESGSLGGIYTALQAAEASHVFCVACDMPFLSSEVIEALAALAQEADVIIPESGGELHTLHAIYAKTCLPFMRRCIESKRLKIVGFFPEVRVKVVSEDLLRRLDPDLTCFINVNTPEEFATATAREAQRPA